MEEKKISPATSLYNTVMRTEQTKSRMRWQQCREQIIVFAVLFGIKFFVDDFCVERGWRGAKGIPVPDEHLYGLAVECNKSAALAIEKYWKRKPFLLSSVEPGDRKLKKPTRIHVGRWFYWLNNIQLKCTSFNDDKKYLTACQYKNNRCHEYNEKPIKRIKITHDDIKCFHKLMKKHEKLINEGDES